jgi:hypothetical protein
MVRWASKNRSNPFSNVNFGSGATILHEGDGWDSPEIIDNSDPASVSNLHKTYTQSATGWTSAAAGFNGTEQVMAPNSNDQATWTFANLGQSAYYDVYVTWSPQPGATQNASFVVMDNGTPINPVDQSSIAPVDQSQAPADDQAAGVFWHHVGVFYVTTGTLSVRLGAATSGNVLADAVRLVKHTAAPTTNLAMGSFSVRSSPRWTSWPSSPSTFRPGAHT